MLNTNLLSLFSQRALAKAEGGVATSIERLSSGLRVNSAKDDAAGLAIAERMNSEIRSSAPLTRGISDGISLIEVAGGGLRGVLDALQRSRELAVQASNSTLTSTDRKTLDAEFKQLKDHINHLANTTEIFGQYPLKGEVKKPVTVTTPHWKDIFPTSGHPEKNIPSDYGKPMGYIPQGAKNVQLILHDYNDDDDLQIFTQDGKHLVGTPLSDSTWGGKNAQDLEIDVFLPENGFSENAVYDASNLLDGSTSFAPTTDFSSHTPLGTPPAVGSLVGTFNGMSFVFSGDGNPIGHHEKLTIDELTEPLVVVVSGGGVFDLTASWDFMPDKSVSAISATTSNQKDTIDILVNATPGTPPSYVLIQKAPSDTETLDIEKSALDPYQKAQDAINELDAAIEKVTGYCAQHGACHNRLESAMNTALVNRESLSAARSRIVDADYAVETSQLARSRVLVDAGLAMLAQANIHPKQVMKLVGGE